MQVEKDKFLSLSLPLVVVFTVLLVAGLLGMSAHYNPTIFQLHFNAYAILSGIGVLGALVLLGRLVAVRSYADEASWFILVVLGYFGFAVGELFQRLSVTPAGAVFWTLVGGYGLYLTPVGFLMFAVTYTRPPERRSKILAPLLIAGAAVVSLVLSGPGLIFDNNPAHISLYAWGFNNNPGPAFFLGLSWVFLPSIVAAAMLMRFHQINRDQLLRKQSLLYSVAVALPVVSGVFVDGILANFIHILPPLGSVIELCAIIMITYGISRFRFFQINSAILADSVLKTMNEAVVVTRPNFMIEFINKEAEHLLGVNSSEITDDYIHRIFTAESWPKIHDNLEGKITAPAGIDDIAIINHAGRRIPVRVFTSNLVEGEHYQALIFVISDISDITESYNKLESDAVRIRALLDESHELQKQLAAEKAGVEHTVEIRTRELRDAQERLKETDKLKTEFIMLGSHNLRTPIAIMANSVDLLKSSPSEHERSVYLESMAHGVDQLRDFAEQMIDIATLESGASSAGESITVAELLKPIVDDFQTLAKAHPELECAADIQDGDRNVQAAVSRLQGAIRNLVNNAFKFTKSGHVNLDVRTDDDSLTIEVSDTGIGIEADEMSKLFTKFHRATSTLEYAYEGTGLGLYLAKLIIDEHGGHVDVHSEPGEGSRFTVRLPLNGNADKVHDSEELS